MKLYLMQHGSTKSEAEDPERSLTAKGEEEVRKVAETAKRMNLQVSQIYHSGKRRAEQTADIVASALGSPVKSAQGLHPLDEVRPWAERISIEGKDLMIVGHLPFLEKLASFLLGGDEKAQLVLFRFGAIVCLDQKDDKSWAVRWILTPEMVG